VPKQNTERGRRKKTRLVALMLYHPIMAVPHLWYLSVRILALYEGSLSYALPCLWLSLLGDAIWRESSVLVGGSIIVIVARLDE
jgi:hypothetical protein